MTTIKDIMRDIGVSNKVLKATKSIQKPEHFNSVKDNIPLVKDLNLQGDLLFLPKTNEGYKYLLVVTDLATNLFDVEPLKEKNATSVLLALVKLFKTSKYIKQPKASFSTDAGSEFKDVVDKWLYKNNIVHKVSIPGRHTQTSNVESLNRLLGRILNNYMSQKELDTGKQYFEWTDILDYIVKELNKVRKNKNLPKDIYDATYPDFNMVGTEIKTDEKPVKTTLQSKYEIWNGSTDGKIYNELLPKFRVGQMVYRKLDKPRNALGNKQSTDAFREGDFRLDIVEPRKIKRILYYNTEPYYRYILNDVPNVSYPESELRLATERREKFIILRLTGRMKRNGITYYKCVWKNAKQHRPSWEPRTELIKDIPDMVEEYDRTHRR